MQLDLWGTTAASAVVRCAPRRTFEALAGTIRWVVSSVRVCREGAASCVRHLAEGIVTIVTRL